MSVLGWLRRLFARAESNPFGGVDPSRARLLVGLGNPGEQYAATRHNLGFRCVDALVERYAARWAEVPDARSCTAVIDTDDLTLVLAKPLTYMNRSGDAVQALLERLELPRQQALVIYDDMDLPFGSVRLREQGSPGTHNGMRSVVRSLHAEDIPRLRIGISQARGASAIEHVLGDFSDQEQAQVDALVARAADAAEAWAKLGAAAAMNRYNKN
jgi:peptidyl-tRNA hydrolase, PTH1 family